MRLSFVLDRKADEQSPSAIKRRHTHPSRAEHARKRSWEGTTSRGTGALYSTKATFMTRPASLPKTDELKLEAHLRYDFPASRVHVGA